MKTLILNAGFEPIQFVSWQRAICLVIAEKAEIVTARQQAVRSVSAEYNLPSVIRLVQYVRRVALIERVRCTRKNILLRDKYECQYCGVRCQKHNATIDHIIPKSKGGKTTWSNAVTACSRCNLKKANKSLEAASMKLLTPARKPRFGDMAVTLSGDFREDWLPYLRF